MTSRGFSSCTCTVSPPQEEDYNSGNWFENMEIEFFFSDYSRSLFLSDSDMSLGLGLTS